MKKNEIPKVSQKEDYVEIEFSNKIPKNKIKDQLAECIDEICECCSTEFRNNVSKFEVEDNEVIKVKVYGLITIEEVNKNVIGCAPKLEKETTTCCLISKKSDCC